MSQQLSGVSVFLLSVCGIFFSNSLKLCLLALKPPKVLGNRGFEVFFFFFFVISSHKHTSQEKGKDTEKIVETIMLTLKLEFTQHIQMFTIKELYVYILV